MENQGFVDSVLREIVHPGVEQLMNGRFFSELREGKLSKRRLQGFALQHYLSNHAINKGLAFCMVKNASNPPVYNQFVELFVEESSHPDLMKRFGLAMGLKDEDFNDEIMILRMRGPYGGDYPRHVSRHAGGNPRRRAGERIDGLPLLRRVRYGVRKTLRAG